MGEFSLPPFDQLYLSAVSQSQCI